MLWSKSSGKDAWRVVVLAAVIAVAPWWLNAAEPESTSPADRLLASAAKAEIDGDSTARTAILRKALAVDPNSRSARWQLGQIELDGTWTDARSAADAAAANPRQAEYAALREASGGNLDHQLTLARWCSKNGLQEEAKVHWLNVLSIVPQHREALRALDAEWVDGQLLTRDQIQQAKEAARRQEPTMRVWNSRLAEWQRMLDGDLPERMQALTAIGNIRQVEAIPILERATLSLSPSALDPQIIRNRQLSMAFLDALEKMPHPRAAESMVRHAVIAPLASIRASAIARLKKKPLEDYVPILLDGLVSPIESNFQVATAVDGSVYYTHSLYQSGRLADRSFDGARMMLQRDLQGDRTYVRQDGTSQELDRSDELQVQMAFTAAETRQRFGRQAVTVEQSLAEWNYRAKEWNELIYPVLQQTTGKELDADPRAWWSWWEEHSDRYFDGPKPLYDYAYSDVDYSFYGAPVTEYEPAPPRPPARWPRGGVSIECFIKGTPVWTKTGLRPIETIRVGDLVLAQDVASGELGYRPVVGTSVRPPSEMLRLSLDGEQLVTTKGHPFWVAGAGWKMAKELTAGDVLHGVDAPARVEAKDAGPMAEAYNLVVAEASTYFVGERGVLVHDNTNRRPVMARVPGIRD